MKQVILSNQLISGFQVNKESKEQKINQTIYFYSLSTLVYLFKRPPSLKQVGHPRTFLMKVILRCARVAEFWTWKMTTNCNKFDWEQFLIRERLDGYHKTNRRVEEIFFKSSEIMQISILAFSPVIFQISVQGAGHEKGKLLSSTHWKDAPVLEGVKYLRMVISSTTVKESQLKRRQKIS